LTGSNRVAWRVGPWLAELEQAFEKGQDPAPIARREDQVGYRRDVHFSEV
jgi:hypothetical protein